LGAKYIELYVERRFSFCFLSFLLSINNNSKIFNNNNNNNKSYIQDSSTLAGSAASAAELNNIAKYSDIIASVDCVPFVIETSGVWGEQVMSLVKELVRRMSEVNKEPRSTVFLCQRLMSVAVQRGNAACILGTLRPVVGGSINDLFSLEFTF